MFLLTVVKGWAMIVWIGLVKSALGILGSLLLVLGKVPNARRFVEVSPFQTLGKLLYTFFI
jgi:hypothetical protein